MRKMYMSLLLIGLAAALIGAGSFAYFSDTETSTGNTFTAGSLDLEVFDGSSWINGSNVNLGWSAVANNMKPGDVEYIEIPVRNVGTVSGLPDFTFDITANSPGTNPEPEGMPDMADLADAIWVEYLCLHGTSSCFLYVGPLSGMDGMNIPAHESLAPGQQETWALYMSVPTSVGNEIMGDYVDFDIVFGLTQD